MDVRLRNYYQPSTNAEHPNTDHVDLDNCIKQDATHILSVTSDTESVTTVDIMIKCDLLERPPL